MSADWYLFFSSSAAVLGFIAVIVAEMSMRKGLTYSAMRATVWTMLIFAIARTWHTFREYVNFKSDLPEIAEYVMYIIAYLTFVLLSLRTRSVKSPHDGDQGGSVV